VFSPDTRKGRWLKFHRRNVGVLRGNANVIDAVCRCFGEGFLPLLTAINILLEAIHSPLADLIGFFANIIEHR